MCLSRPSCSFSGCVRAGFHLYCLLGMSFSVHSTFAHWGRKMGKLYVDTQEASWMQKICIGDFHVFVYSCILIWLYMCLCFSMLIYYLQAIARSLKFTNNQLRMQLQTVSFSRISLISSTSILCRSE